MPTLLGWKAKALALALASCIPAGRALYQRVQDRRAARGDDSGEMLERALDLLALYRAGGGDPRGRDHLEVGTGWSPWVPVLLRIAGAARIVTVDVNPWLSHMTAVTVTRGMIEQTRTVADATGRSEAAIRADLTSALATSSLDEWLSVLGIEYRRTPVQDLDVPEQSFDAVLSSNVLEHVPTTELPVIHAASWRLLRDAGLVVHRFNPQDHFSEVDRSITGANFLQYSEAQWRWLGGSGLAYHNRLRCTQHARLVSDAGFEIVYTRTRPDERARQAIEAGVLNVHPEFAGMSPTELSDDYMWLVARKAALTVRGERT